MARRGSIKGIPLYLRMYATLPVTEGAACKNSSQK